MCLASAALPSALLAALFGIACFVLPAHAQGAAVREVQQGVLEPSVAVELDGDLEQLDGYLDQVEKSTRRYFFSWLVVGAGLVTSQAYVAATWDNKAVRGSYWIGTALGGTSLLLQLISPKPALLGVARYRKLRSHSPEEKQAKLAYGARILAGQAKADMRAISVVQHLTGVVAALGAGLGVGLGWDDSLKQAITRSVGVFLVAELQIISRPRTSIERVEAWGQHGVQASVVPMLERDVQGLMLAGTF